MKEASKTIYMVKLSDSVQLIVSQLSHKLHEIEPQVPAGAENKFFYICIVCSRGCQQSCKV